MRGKRNETKGDKDMTPKEISERCAEMVGGIEYHEPLKQLDNNSPEQIQRDLFLALHQFAFVVRGETHFGACGIRHTDYCTTPKKCGLAREVFNKVMEIGGGMKVE